MRFNVNTQPSMTKRPLAPPRAAHAELSFGRFVHWTVEGAPCDR